MAWSYINGVAFGISGFIEKKLRTMMIQKWVWSSRRRSLKRIPSATLSKPHEAQA